jgi:hypothetical protein
MDEETKNANKDTEDAKDVSDDSFDNAAEESTGRENTGETPQNTMQYILIGLAVLVLFLNIYSIAQINTLGGKISSLNKVTGLAVYDGSSNKTSGTTLPTVTTTAPLASTTLPAADSTQKVNVIVLNDKRCTECSFVSDVLTQLSSVFTGMTTTNIDYGTTEGKELYADAQIKYLPAILFSDDVKDAQNYSQIQQYLEPAGKYQYLRIGATFDPAAEICDNSIDDDANGFIDCKDPGCKDKLVCRNETKKDIQVFVMSDCPYGRQAIIALNYIANEQGGEFSSLHGQYEVDEDIVQLCVKEYSPDEWLDYINCRSINGVNGIDWHTCASEAGITSIAVKTVEKCANGSKGKELLGNDIKLAGALDINSSPTWLANNRYEFSAIDAETAKQNLCKYNAGLKGCDITLNASTSGLTATGACA